MAYENFIPTVWAEAINRELEKALVYAEGCNRQYDGEVKAMGDTVRILGVGRPTITTTTDKAITLSAPESVEDSSVTLAVRQISYFNYKVDDIDKRQAVGGVMEALNKEATYGLADEMDKHIAGMAATREAVKYAASATAITKDNVLGEIDKALEKEGKAILGSVRKGAAIVAMCIEGKQISSDELAQFLADRANSGAGDVAFVIGSSHGLSDEVKRAAALKFSMGRITMPHQLARLVLTEQIYRACTINAGMKYHK